MSGSADSCIFCRIAAKGIPARIAREDERVVAFHDVDPKAPVHVLVIPRKHIAGVGDADDRLLGHLVATARDLAKELGVAESGYRLVVNSGPDGGQSVFHLHLHLLGGRAMAWPPG